MDRVLTPFRGEPHYRLIASIGVLDDQRVDARSLLFVFMPAFKAASPSGTGHYTAHM
ncbi:hypothetical protein BKA56DRAFT_578938 [Ilyonectria sp. MPI-CAGE-AT-0026]|nr:hypothetical protein BKA56DRAFT_578938 [Ilyonectria sp. MPI-CAGE-AT-0026]